MTTTPLHSMTPTELAHHGIPVEVALRAEIEAGERGLREAIEAKDAEANVWQHGRLYMARRFLAIIEAKGTP